MALKRKITKEEFEKLSESIQEIYIESKDGYELDVDFEDVDKLFRAKMRESEKRKEFQEQLEAAQARVKELEEGQAANNGDIRTLQRGWNEERAKLENEFKSKLSEKDSFITRMLIENAAMQFSNEVFKNPSRDSLHVRSRISVDMSDSEPKVIILDKTGKPSEMTFDDLKKEFVDNEHYSDIVLGSKATGGGATEKPTINTSGSFNGANNNKVDWSTLSPAEAVKLASGLMK